MSIAIVIAGGSGVRTGYAVPKQFLTIYDKPIFIYTLENIQRISMIERIVLVIPDGWEAFVNSYCSLYNLDKNIVFVKGGKSRFYSIYNGIKEIYTKEKENEIVLICDGNRPLTPERIFTDLLGVAQEKGIALTAEACTDSLFECVYEAEGILVAKSLLDRSKIYKGQCPECAKLSLLHDVYERAHRDNLGDLPMSALFLHYGMTVVTVKGSSKNFKITTADDIELFKAFVTTNREK